MTGPAVCLRNATSFDYMDHQIPPLAFLFWSLVCLGLFCLQGRLFVMKI